MRTKSSKYFQLSLLTTGDGMKGLEDDGVETVIDLDRVCSLLSSLSLVCVHISELAECLSIEPLLLVVSVSLVFKSVCVDMLLHDVDDDDEHDVIEIDIDVAVGVDEDDDGCDDVKQIGEQALDSVCTVLDFAVTVTVVVTGVFAVLRSSAGVPGGAPGNMGLYG